MRAEDLTPVELRVRDAFSRGEKLDLRVGNPQEDRLENSERWGPERVVRGSALTWLLLDGAVAEPGHVPALRLDGARVDGSLELDYAEIPYRVTMDGCDFRDRVTLYSARTRQFSLKRCRLVRFYAANASVDGALKIHDSQLDGLLNLDGTHITGILNLDGSWLTNSDGPALTANRLQVDDDIRMGDGFTAKGEVILRGAHAGGDLDMRDRQPDMTDRQPQRAQLLNRGHVALLVSRMHVEGDVLCDEIKTVGEVDFSGARVDGAVRFRGAQLSNPGGRALHGYHLQVGTSLHLDRGFTAEGSIDLAGARVNGLITLCNAQIMAPDGVALAMPHTQAEEVDLRMVRPPQGLVDLRHAMLGIIRDESRSWPDELKLDGLRFNGFENPLTPRQRIRWLLRDQAGYTPQPFEQLALSYRSLGHDDEARTISLLKERLRRKTLPRHARTWGAIQDITVGYGYRPMRAGLWLLGLLALGSVVFTVQPPARTASAGTEVFNPVIFTLDRLLPIIGLGQGTAFTPTPGTQWIGYLLTGCGWILATTIVTGFTRSLNRR
ncbi:oxidoreductase [Streptomyces sp. NPDC050597]|uniref:oxidoreductase n=1 Tax=Streptomyces sp. NPDC050597 TaxID=3157212 RepID=UPI0034310787